jgi:uncharacterized membrane protein
MLPLTCLLSLLAAATGVVGFAPTTTPTTTIGGRGHTGALFFFDKVFEEDGPLGKGITVGKVQVALSTSDRSADSIFGVLKRQTENAGSTSYDLACMGHEVCLELLRRADSWVAASSDSEWFKESDSGKAESLFNDWTNREAVKFEKEYIPDTDSALGAPTTVVVSVLVEIVGENTDFDGGGYSMSETKEILQSIASNVMVEDGDFVNAVEVFWAPGDSDEVLSKHDLIVDFPELITL